MNLFKWLLPKEKNVVFCRDCKHLRTVGSDSNLWTCEKSTYVSSREADIVTGLGAYEKKYNHSADWERSRHGKCGIKGKLFEPKETQ